MSEHLFREVLVRFTGTQQWDVYSLMALDYLISGPYRGLLSEEYSDNGAIPAETTLIVLQIQGSSGCCKLVLLLSVAWESTISVNLHFKPIFIIKHYKHELFYYQISQ